MLAGDLLSRAVAIEAGRPEGAATGLGWAPGVNSAWPPQLTWAEVDAAANRFAQHLRDGPGVAPGGRIAILANNHPAWLVALFGAARAGAVTATMPVRSTAPDIARMIEMCAPAVLVCDAAGREKAPKVPCPVLAMDDAEGMGRFLEGGNIPPPAPGIDETAPFAITFTGGTTGQPKAVVVSHRSRILSAAFGLAHFGFEADDRIGIATPLYHAAGLVVWLPSVVMLGLPCWMPSAWDAEGFMAATEAGRVTNVLLVPTQIHDLLHCPDFDAARLANLRTINYAAAPMPLELLQRAMAALPHVTFRHHLGQSECGPVAAQAHSPGDPPERLRSVGRPWDRYDVRLLDPDGEPVPRGEPGEIATRGAHVFDGYLDAPEETAAVMAGDWCRTGDIAVADEEGYLTLVDRAKDMIIAGGVNIFPREIENALYAHPAVSECAVFGIPDDRLGEVPAAHVVLEAEVRDAPDGGAPDGEALVAWCAERIAPFKRPRRVEIVDALPKTPVGKIQKHLIRAPYWDAANRKL